MNTPSPDPERPRRPWQPRFGIPGLFLVVLIASVMAAAGSYFVRVAWDTSPGQGKSSMLAFLLIATAGPALMLVVVAGLLALLRRR